MWGQSTWGWSLILAVFTCLPGVWAINDTGPVIASSAVAFVMLLILISVVVFAVCYSDSWVRSNMRREGKVKLPKSYFRKKKEAKRRLLEARSQSLRSSNYTAPKPVISNGVAGGPPAAVIDKDKMVQGWNQTSSPYEEKAYSIELGEEQDNDAEFQIETTLVDNEVLDVGPFRNLESGSAMPVDGNVYKNPYLYSNDDRSARSGSKKSDKVAEGQGLVSVMAKDYGSTTPDLIIDDIIMGNGSTVKSSSMDDQIIQL